MTNIEKQADEILALQSIFDKKFRHLDENQYEILVEFDLVSPFTIEFNHKTSIIQYLPPLTLIINYHDEYPSDYPPLFILSCFYFSKFDLEKLCEKLDNYPFIKEEVCVYDWIELIKNEINNKIIFRITFEQQTNDPRALNGYSNENAGKIFQYLIDYNHKREEEQFENQLQTCLICENIIPGIDCIRLYCCNHFYCRFCLNNYVQRTLENGLFGEKLHCPQNQCKQSLLPIEIKRILQNDQLYERYERLTLQHGLELMNDIVWCPRCQSPVLSGTGDDKLAVCDQCYYTFCKKCKETFHSQTICRKDYLVEQIKLQKEKALEQLKLQNQEKLEKIQEKEKFVLNRIIKAKEKEKTLLGQTISTQEYRQVVIKLSEQDNLLEEVLTAEKIDSLGTERCPKCNIHIEKNGGCSHMHCSRCDQHFIWGTKRRNKLKKFLPLLTNNAQDFMELESVKEELYKVTNIVETSKEDDETKEKQNEEELRISFDNQSVIGFAILNRVKQCPNKLCGKNNVKIAEDNWMVCSECMKQYCFLCTSTLNGAQHFDKKCVRYTRVNKIN